MQKLTKVAVATALGLMIGLSMFTSGAFAQSVNANTLNGNTHVTVSMNEAHRIAPIYQSNQSNQRHGTSPAYHGNKGHARHLRCVNVVRYVRYHHHLRRVVQRSCHWQ